MCKRLFDFFKHKTSADDLKMEQLEDQFVRGNEWEKKVALAEIGSLQAKHASPGSSYYYNPKFLGGIFHRDRNANADHRENHHHAYKR